MPTKKTTAKRTTSSTATNKTTEPTVETVATGETSSPLDFSATTVQVSGDTSSVNVGTFDSYDSEVSTTISSDINGATHYYNSSTTTTSPNVNSQSTTSADTLSTLMDMLAGMKQQMDSIQKELDSTKQELAQEKANNGFNKQNLRDRIC